MNWRRIVLLSPDGDAGGAGGDSGGGDGSPVTGGGAPPAPGTPNTPPAMPTLHNQLPPELAQSQSLSKFQNVGDLARSYTELSTKLGEMGNTHVKIPGEDAKPEERAAFLERLGRPKDPKEYDYSVEPGATLDEKSLDQTRELFHDLGLTKEQGQKIMDHYIGNVLNAGLSATQEAAQEAETKLKEEWGRDYDGNKVLISNVLRQFGNNDLIHVLERTGLGNDPHIYRFLVNVGREMVDDESMGGVYNTAFGTTAADAKTQIENLKQDKDFMAAFMSREHPGHQSAVNKWHGLHKAAYSEGG